MTDQLLYQGTEEYIVSNDLRNSVNISVALKRPLTLEGLDRAIKKLMVRK